MSTLRRKSMALLVQMVLALSGAAMTGLAAAQGPSYACDGVRAGSIEAMVCEDASLSMLDRKLSEVYAKASEAARSERPSVLRARQLGWIKGRNECRKSNDKRRCVEDSYRLRIAELQARYRLVANTGPITYRCDGDPAHEVVAVFLQTDPSTLIAERGDSVSVMYLQPSASGARYQGRNEALWEHHGEALITWGFGAPQMRCARAP